VNAVEGNTHAGSASILSQTLRPAQQGKKIGGFAFTHALQPLDQEDGD
jgi:hypothetical protein